MSLQGTVIKAFSDELEKIATQERVGVWSPKTIGAPRSKLPGSQAPKAPTAPGKLNAKLVRPAPQFGKRQQTYSQPNPATAPNTNPTQSVAARHKQPPNVVFGVR